MLAPVLCSVLASASRSCGADSDGGLGALLGSRCIVMSYCESGDLSQVIKEARRKGALSRL
jgi:hypothetical protein